MKRKTIVAVALLSILLTACAGREGQEGVSDSTVSTLVVTEEITTTEDAIETSDVTVPESVTVPDIKPLTVDDPYTFNVHVCPKKLYDAYGPEEWESFFNLCDALEAGEDSFECSSRDAYEWCFSGGPLSKYYPVARFYVTADYINGYQNGIGHFTYDIPKEEFMQKQKDFEQLVVDILNENVRKDYTDFEKCVALYEYMVTNYTYDYVQCANNDVEIMNTLPKDSFGTYRTFRDKEGICDNLSAVYNFLLLQCGVEAVQFEGQNHAWTYVTIDGEGYFIDPTWGLHSECFHDLDYFMMTEADREPYFGDDMHPVMFYYEHKNKDVDFSATDDKYAVLHGGDFVALDTENKILYYDLYGELKEFHYEA